MALVMVLHNILRTFEFHLLKRWVYRSILLNKVFVIVLVVIDLNYESYAHNNHETIVHKHRHYEQNNVCKVKGNGFITLRITNWLNNILSPPTFHIGLNFKLLLIAQSRLILSRLHFSLFFTSDEFIAFLIFLL